MLIQGMGRAVGGIFYQRCFYLFLMLMAFIAVVSFIEPTRLGRIVIAGANAFLVVATVASVGRNTLSFVLALVLAGPGLVYQWIALQSGDPHALVISRWFAAALYAMGIGYLMRYVFQRQVMTADKLFGAASMYLLLGVFWAFLYALVENYHPGSFTLAGQPTNPGFFDFVYFSFTVLTSTGFGDLAPLGRQARGLCTVEQIVGSLFVAILIARLAGVYPPGAKAE
ncbi:MAG: two pore domain potassium channel family protein [Xanthomonadales bacterium]|nr:two pore domain potassium channel family protein [Xanthomonadales bacterium]